MKQKILIVEDDAGFGTMLQKWFERNDFEVFWCTDTEKAKKTLASDSYDLVLSDLRLPDGDGIMLLAWMREKSINIPVIIMTGYGEVQTAVSAIKLGASDFLEKPINPSLLKQKIASTLKTASKNVAASVDNTATKEASAETISGMPSFVKGNSESAQKLYQHIQLVAPTNMTVMVIGESGTGKEHVARMIHNESTRKESPFIAVDCGSLSVELAASELFGHKKGSFTSAITDKEGLFVEANGGTVFLDEVGNLSYHVQTQLLRALQERKVRPVGAVNDINIDVRIVTATNENLEKAIEAGKFREDLYHRLNEFMITVPPLRERIGDIELYSTHFLKQASTELAKEIKRFSASAMEQLERYTFPGNLRELRNIVRRSVLFATGTEITPEDLPILSIAEETKVVYRLKKDAETEKEQIVDALSKTNGNKAKAARLLQIDRKTLYNKIHLYGLDL